MVDGPFPAGDFRVQRRHRGLFGVKKAFPVVTFGQRNVLFEGFFHLAAKRWKVEFPPAFQLAGKPGAAARCEVGNAAAESLLQVAPGFGGALAGFMAQGYTYIGMDHFARPEDELAVAQRNKQLQRNFQGYSTRAGADIYAFGMSSISQIPEAYWQNEKELPKYQAALDEGRVPLHRAYFVTEDDRIRRETIMRVMCDLSLDYQAMSQKLGVTFEEYFAKELAALEPMEQDGLVRFVPGGLEVTDAGRLFIRNVAMCFDNTLAPMSERRHSKTI